MMFVSKFEYITYNVVYERRFEIHHHQKEKKTWLMWPNIFIFVDFINSYSPFIISDFYIHHH